MCKDTSKRKLTLKVRLQHDRRPTTKVSKESLHRSRWVMVRGAARTGGVCLGVASSLTAGRAALWPDSHRSVTQPGIVFTSSSPHCFILLRNLMMLNCVLI